MTHIQVRNRKKNVLVMSPKYTPVTQSIQRLSFLTYVRTVQCLIYGGQESKTKSLQFMILKHL